MKKSGLIFGVLLLVLVGSVLAEHTATITLSPLSGYETVKKSFTMYIENGLGGDNINSVTISLPNFIINEVRPKGGWTSSISGNSIVWSTINSTISEGAIHPFWFNATPNQVTSDTNSLISVVTQDVTNWATTNPDKIYNILNDATPPALSNPIPSNNSIIKNTTTNFSIDVSELQTAVKSGRIYYDFYDVLGDRSTYTHYADLVCTQTYCSVSVTVGTITRNYMTYKFEVNDSVDNAGIIENSIAIDGENPSVSLISASGTATNGVAFTLDYTANDNSFGFSPLVNPQLTCDLMVDGVLNNQQILSAGGANSFNVNTAGLADGSHNWQVICTDKAGWTTSSETRSFILDTTGPEIVLDSPANNSIIRNGTTVGVSVNDIYSNPVNVWYTIDNGQTNTTTISYNIATDSWPAGLVSMIVYAADSLGNPSQSTFEFTVDNSPPTLIIISPLNGDVSNSPVTFLYNAADPESGIKECKLTTNTSVTQTTTSTTNIIAALAEGSHAWTITCENNVGLFVDSTPIVVIVDTTPPTVDLTLFNLLDNTNDDDGNVNIPYTASDANNIANCSLYVNGLLNQTTTVAPFTNFLLNIAPSNAAYNVSISCTDIVGNIFSSPQIEVYYDNIAPVISGVSVSPGSDSAVINWNTNEYSNGSSVSYTNNDTSISSSANEGSPAVLVTQHTLTLSSLAASTVYYYQIFSKDQWGNVGNSTLAFFTTSATPSTPGGGGGGGGGGSSELVTACGESDFVCSAWGDCQGNGRIGSQSRTCNLKEGIQCEGGFTPLSLRECALPQQTKEEPGEEVKKETGGLTGITGFSILDGLKSAPAQALLISLFVILIIYAFYRYLRNPKVPDTIIVNE